MSLIQKFKNEKLTNKEKKLFLKICLVLEIEEFYDWLDCLKITKKVKSALFEVTGCKSISDAFIFLIKGEYEPIGFIYDEDYEAIFSKNNSDIDYFKFLQNIQITPSKINDLFVALSFNVSYDVFDDVNEENIINRYQSISILKSNDNFFIAE